MIATGYCLDGLRWLRHRIDITIGHNLIMGTWVYDSSIGNGLQHWWYLHVCQPSGIWECRDLPD